MSQMKLPEYFADILIRDYKVGRIRREFFILYLKFQEKIIREWQNYKSGAYTHHPTKVLPVFASEPVFALTVTFHPVS